MDQDGEGRQVTHRQILSLTLMGAFGLLLPAACGGETEAAATQDDAAAGPVVTAGALEVSASAPKTATLGQMIQLTVTLKNTGGAAERVNVPRLGRHSVAVKVSRDGAKTTWLERLHADLDERTGDFKWKMPESRDLEAGKTLSVEIPIVATVVGKQTLVAQYRRAGEDPVTCSPLEIEVKPDGEKSNLGVRLATTHGDLVVKLRGDLAMNTVESFASLVAKGYFDGLTFHRIVAGFMAQGGDPKGTGGGGPGYYLPLEAHSDLLHDRGVLSMARTNVPDTAGSQFFLMFTRYPSLDPMPPRSPGYTAFGETVEGDDTLKKMEAVPVQWNRPEVIEDLKRRGAVGARLEQALQQLARQGQIEKSQPTERVAIEKATLLTLK